MPRFFPEPAPWILLLRRPAQWNRTGQSMFNGGVLGEIIAGNVLFFPGVRVI